MTKLKMLASYLDFDMQNYSQPNPYHSHEIY